VHAGSEPRGGDGRTAVEAALDALIGDRTVLCIDEFSVNDIADGMLSYRLFTELFARGLHLVVTSNYPPDDLLPHPVYHELYLPGIAQLTRELTVIEVGGATDLRTTPPGAAAAPAPSAEASRASADAFRRGRVFRPADSVGVEAALAQWGLPGSPLPAPTPTRIPIGHHEIVATAAVGTALRIDFDTLCRGARATLDYLHLTDRFTRVVIDGVPRISREPEAVRRRWINLVDVLYDRAVDVVLVSEYPLADLMDVDDANRDTARTNSRLALLGPGTD
jgi:cell division protein ZapE